MKEGLEERLSRKQSGYTIKAVLLLCLCVATLSCRSASDTFADVPLESCSGIPCVAVSLDGGPQVRLVLDFANWASYLTVASARRARIADVSPAELRKAESSFKPILANVDRMEIGTAVLSDSIIVIEPQSKLGFVRDPPPAGDGGLSFKAFKDRLIILDIPHKRLRISTKPYGKTIAPTGFNRLVEARFGDFAPNIIASKGFAINNRPITATIDTTYAGTIIAHEPIQGVVSFLREPIKGRSLRDVSSRNAEFQRLSWRSPLFHRSRIRCFCGAHALQFSAAF